jgi:DNA helicase INO80
MDAASHSPVSPSVYQSMNRGAVQPPPQSFARPPSTKDDVSDSCSAVTLSALLTRPQAPPPTRADPMSLSSIMSSGADNEPPAKPQQPSPFGSDHHRVTKPTQNPLFVKQEQVPSPAPADLLPHENGYTKQASYEPFAAVHPAEHNAPRELPLPDEAEVQAALAHIETTQMNDLDPAGIPHEREMYVQRSRKRALDVASAEDNKRKVRLQSISIQYT